MQKTLTRRRSTTSGGTRAPHAQVIVRVRRPGSDQTEELPPAQISDVLPTPDALVWVDIQDPGEAELAMLRTEFDFSALSLEDSAKQQQRPKIDEYPGYYFLVMYAPKATPRKRELEIAEVDLFVGQNFVVSLHKGRVPALEDALERWEKARPDLQGRVGFLTHSVVDTIVDAFFPIVDDIDNRLDALESTMFRGNRSANSEELLAVKRSLFTLRKAIYPLRESFHGFPRREQSLFSEEARPYFDEVYDHILRLLDLVDILRDMTSDAMDAHLAFVSSHLDETMKRLTVVGICIGIGGVMFGAWGMNFKDIPFQQTKIGNTPIGFWIVCGITAILIGAALFWARKRDMW